MTWVEYEQAVLSHLNADLKELLSTNRDEVPASFRATLTMMSMHIERLETALRDEKKTNKQKKFWKK